MKTFFVVVFLWITGFSASLMAGDGKSFNPEFYAFANGVSFNTVEDEARELKALGYSGIAQVHNGGEDLANRVAAYDKAGLS